MSVRPNEKYLPLRNPGSKGWNAFNEPASIDDLELVDIQNMNYDLGFISPREGSTLLYSKPSAETENPLQLIKAETSDGIRYVVAVYANHFYVWHPTSLAWIRINQTYVPVETTRRYGNVNWNNGRGDDRLYVCNGVDDAARWDVCVGVVSGAHTAGAATITLTDGSRFPTGGGTLILQTTGGGALFTEAYTSRSGNVFTLTNTLNVNIDTGSPCVTDMIQKAVMEVGKYLSKHQRRLIMANYYGGETVVWGSVQGDPENFTLAATIAGAFTQTFADGNGEITGLNDFGKFLVVEKQDSLHAMRIQVAADLGSKLVVIEPLIAGSSVGPLALESTVVIENRLYYPTRSSGFVSMTPTTSGDSVSVGVKPLSLKIDPYLRKEITLTGARSASSSDKVFWSVTRTGATENTIVLEYDIRRDAWTKHFGWAAKDLLEINNEVLYLDVGTGNVLQINNGSYNDNGQEYLASASFKRFDYGEVGRPKSQDIIYIEGYMTPATEFFVDVYFNENGVLGKQVFRINRTTTGLSFSDPITDAMGSFVLGLPILGMSALAGIANLSVFRGFLAIDIAKGFFNIQPRVYGTRAAFWGITALAMNPEVVPIVPLDFTIVPETST